MRYLASVPLMAPYLEQYLRYHSGSIDNETVDLKNYQDASVMLKRNLVPFVDESAARKRWPTMFECDTRVGTSEISRMKPAQDAFYVLGPKGAYEVVCILQAHFDMSLIQEWTQTCVDYSKTMSMPSKRCFVMSFMERHGILPVGCEYNAVMKRFQRITEKENVVTVQKK